MIDLYVDDVSLVKIQEKDNQQILIFSNSGKDESISIPVTNDELLNIYQKVRMRCETLGLKNLK